MAKIKRLIECPTCKGNGEISFDNSYFCTIDRVSKYIQRIGFLNCGKCRGEKEILVEVEENESATT